MGPGTVQAIERLLGQMAQWPDALVAGATDVNRAGERYAARHAPSRQPVRNTATFRPQEQSVNERIRFDRTKFDSKGRNGYVGTTGINVVDLGEELFLEPITTRGLNSEACRIVLPKSAITALIEALEKIALGPRGSLPRNQSGEQALDHVLTPARGAEAAAE
jgi:hypothetical protein